MTTTIQEISEKSLLSVGVFNNQTDQKMIIYLEITCEEIHLSPNDEIELFVENDEGYFPMSFVYHKDGLQIYPNETPTYCTDWFFKFQGKMYKAVYQSILSELE